jgi:hypothetical protein
LITSHSHESVVAQVATRMVRKKARKVVKFSTILHLLLEYPMLEYEAMKPLFELMAIPKNNNKTLD